MSRWWFLSVASLALACGDDAQPCGAAIDGPPRAALLSAGGEAIEHQEFTAGENNDCPPCAPGECPVSVTLTGFQELDPDRFPITFCLPRPAEITAAAISLADTDMIQIQDISARGATCTYARDPAGTPTGTVTFEGFCTTAGMGYNMTLQGSVPGIRTCPGDAGTTQEPVPLDLSGTVHVSVTVPPS
jgi:hypothetical protein